MIPVLAVSLAHSQHLTADWNDGEVWGLIGGGTTYHCMPDSNGFLSIEPSPPAGLDSYPLTVWLRGAPSSKISIRFGLPSYLAGGGCDTLSCTWESTGLLWAEAGRYFDPRVSQMVEIGADSFATLYLGINVNIPANSGNDWYGDRPIYVTAIDSVQKDTVSLNAYYLVSVYSRETGDFDGAVRGLSKGATYALDPEHSTIQPVVNGKESGVPLMFKLGIMPCGAVNYQFALPSVLNGPLGQTIACSFDTNSLYWTEGHLRLDPESTKCLPSDSGGFITLMLGITTVIPSQAPSGDYSAPVYMNLQYCGFYGKRNRTSLRTLEVASYTVTVVGASSLLDAVAAPREYSLGQNYPNPFNPSTVIRYTLPRESDVQLRIFDVLGRDVTTLVDGRKPAGEYTIRWDAVSVPGGLYFYRVVAGSWSGTKKMLLVR